MEILIFPVIHLSFLFPLCQDVVHGHSAKRFISAFDALDSLRQNVGHNAIDIQNALRAAVPGITYPQLFDIPNTSFDCAAVPTSGFYADVEAGCQVFRRCSGRQMYSYLCPHGTLFNQIVLTCDWWYNVNCNKSGEFFTFSNSRLYKTSETLFDEATTSEPVTTKLITETKLVIRTTSEPFHVTQRQSTKHSGRRTTPLVAPLSSTSYSKPAVIKRTTLATMSLSPVYFPKTAMAPKTTRGKHPRTVQPTMSEFNLQSAGRSWEEATTPLPSTFIPDTVVVGPHGFSHSSAGVTSSNNISTKIVFWTVEATTVPKSIRFSGSFSDNGTNFAQPEGHSATNTSVTISTTISSRSIFSGPTKLGNTSFMTSESSTLRAVRDTVHVSSEPGSENITQLPFLVNGIGNVTQASISARKLVHLETGADVLDTTDVTSTTTGEAGYSSSTRKIQSSTSPYRLSQRRPQ